MSRFNLLGRQSNLLGLMGKLNSNVVNLLFTCDSLTVIPKSDFIRYTKILDYMM